MTIITTEKRLEVYFKNVYEQIDYNNKRKYYYNCMHTIDSNHLVELRCLKTKSWGAD